MIQLSDIYYSKVSSIEFQQDNTFKGSYWYLLQRSADKLSQVSAVALAEEQGN